MDNLKLTVAVAIYNIESYLSKCLESLLNQTEKENYEILLINDGSTDKSRAICKEFVDKGLNAKIIDKENGGLSSVRNLSMDLAKGEYILFLDGDDYIEPNTIEIIFKELENYDLLIFGFNWVSNEKIYRDERFLENKIYTKSQKIKNLLFEDKVNCSVWNKVFKTEILKKNRIKFLEFKSCEDAPFTTEVLQNCQDIKIIDEILYQYLYRENSLSNEKKIEYYYNHLELILYFLNTIKDKNFYFYNYIIKEYVYLVRELRKKESLRKDLKIKNLRKKIEKEIGIINIILNKIIPTKMKLRYFKLLGRE